MAGDEVDARIGRPAALLIEVARTGQAGGELIDRAAVALPEAADHVAVLAVPFRPQHRKVADLVAARPNVPRFGDQLDLAKNGVLMNDVEERAQAVDLEQLARQRAGQVEAEAVDV